MWSTASLGMWAKSKPKPPPNPMTGTPSISTRFRLALPPRRKRLVTPPGAPDWLERIADDVVKVKARQPLAFGETVRVDNDQRAELLGFLPERREGWIGQFLAGNIGENLDALEAERFHAALEFLGGFVAVLHRHRTAGNEAVLMA